MSGEGLLSPGDEVDTSLCNPRFVVGTNPEFRCSMRLKIVVIVRLFAI